jgi:hypothetical protein
VLYYLHETNPTMGWCAKDDPNAPVSIAAVGMTLACIPVIVERGVIIREFAAKITLKKLRYPLQCPQGPEPTPPGTRALLHFLTSKRTSRLAVELPPSIRRFYSRALKVTYFDRAHSERSRDPQSCQCA